MTSKLQLTTNGKTILIPIQFTDEQLKQITAAMNLNNNLTGWEEPAVGRKGYYEDKYNKVYEFEVNNDTIDFAKKLYENYNYFSTKEIAENTVRADNILRKLRHYAISHRASDIHMAEGGYTITYNYNLHCLEIGATGNWLALGDIVFDTEEIAREAINLFTEELIWYFTEGKAAM